MASINVNDYLTGAKTLSLDGKYLIAQTRDDGITGTWAGNYIYKVQKSGANYFVIEQKWDFDKLAWVEKYVDEKAKKGTVQKYGAYYRSIIESNEYENALAENARIEAEREKRSQTIAIQMAQHKEEMERENIETNQIIENGFYSLSIDALQSFVRIYQNHLDKLAAEPEINEEAIGRTLATLDKYKNRIREIQKKELEAEYGTDIQEEFSSQASAEIPPSNTQQQMDFNALLNGLVNAKRVF